MARSSGRLAIREVYWLKFMAINFYPFWRATLTNSQRLSVRLSEIRQALNSLAGLETLTDEQRQESDKLQKEFQDKETQYRGAVIAESDAERRALATEPDAEHRERVKLRSEAKLTNYLLSAMRGGKLEGPELELQAAAKVNQIPVELFDVPEKRAGKVETRVDVPTPAPTTGTGVNLDPIRPMIYARSVIPRLGIAMPSVGSGTYSTATVTTGLSAAALAKGADAMASAAALTPQTTTPHRVSARLSLQIEDIATIGVENFESILRQNLMLALSDRLDYLGLTGDGQGANPEGLLAQLDYTAVTDPTSIVDWGGFIQSAADGIDGGPWAESMTNVRLLANPDTMKLSERVFQTTASYAGEISAASYLRSNSAGFFSSRRMPDTVSTVSQGLRVLMGTMGMDGVDAMRLAVCPVWAEIGIDDIFSDSASGTRNFTLHHLIGDILIEQASAYQPIKYKVS